MKEEIISRIQYPLCGEERVPWLGLYGGGEFIRLGGKNLEHATSSTVYVLLRKDSEVKKE
jgi:hypothetical protein